MMEDLAWAKSCSLEPLPSIPARAVQPKWGRWVPKRVRPPEDWLQQGRARLAAVPAR
jgi:hypothetical protein